MDKDEFKTQIAQCNELSDVDALCFKWLKSAAEDYGRQGEVALKLLDIAQEMLS